jgi:hypothetical protein
MTLQAYITVGTTDIPVLFPSDRMRETARQIGIDEADLFRIDNPAGLSRHFRASLMIASTQLATLYADSVYVSLTLDDGSGFPVVYSRLTARPPQPLFYGQQGGTVLVELVDDRWAWKFSTAATGNALYSAWSSDGRWEVNDLPDIGTLTAAISTAASSFALQMPFGYTTPPLDPITRLSDFVGSPNISLALLLDAIAVASSQVIIHAASPADPTQNPLIYVNRDSLFSYYDDYMRLYKRAIRGGCEPTAGVAGGNDALVNLWNTYGYQRRCPGGTYVIYPSRYVEGMTVYDNCALSNTIPSQRNFATNSLSFNYQVPVWNRIGVGPGVACLTESAVVTNSSSGVLKTPPGWDPAALTAAVAQQYAGRYRNVPFGRTVWAGWLNAYAEGLCIGQIGCVSYRLAIIDGELSPYTISIADENDWIFGAPGYAETDPAKVITAKGKAQAYRNCVGSTIIDAPPPNTRVFPARITSAEQYATWKWRYGFVEVEPEQSIPGHLGKQAVDIGSYARTGDVAINMSENGNIFVSNGNIGNVIAPGVNQSDYGNGQVVYAKPISAGTIVMMCEHFPTVSVANQLATATFKPQYWFSMANAVLVTCGA